jgi:asparagine synthetase B (glutamine-hydrolysing)
MESEREWLEARKRKREAEVQSLDERIAKEKEAKIVEDKEKEAKGLIVRCPFCDKVLLPNYLSRHLRTFHLSNYEEEKEAKKVKNEEEKEAKKAKNEEEKEAKKAKNEEKSQKQGREGGEKSQKRGREGSEKSSGKEESWSYTYGTWRTLVGTVENIYCRLQIFAST